MSSLTPWTSFHCERKWLHRTADFRPGLSSLAPERPQTELFHPSRWTTDEPTNDRMHVMWVIFVDISTSLEGLVVRDDGSLRCLLSIRS